MAHSSNKPLRVFVVEDDYSCEPMLTRIIQSINPDAIVEWQGSAESALPELMDLSARHIPVDLIVADIFLEGRMTGLELWRYCQEEFPDTPVLVTSGMSADRFFEMLGRQEISPPFLAKPFRAGECKQVISGLLEYGGEAA